MRPRQDIVHELADAGLITVDQAAEIRRVGGLGAAVSYSAIGTGAAVTDPAGGTTVDAEARAALVALLDELRTLGIIAT